MPPKTDIDAFIAACFRALKERPQVDWSRVAKETGMSDRGAQNKFRDWTKKFGQDYSDQEASTAKSSSTAKKPNAKRKAIATDGFESDADDKDGVVVGKNGQHSGQSPRKKAKTSAAPKKSTASRSSTKVTVEDVSADTGNDTEEDTADTEKGTGSRGVAKSRDGSVSSSEGTRHPVGRESSAEFV